MNIPKEAKTSKPVSTAVQFALLSNFAGLIRTSIDSSINSSEDAYPSIARALNEAVQAFSLDSAIVLLLSDDGISLLVKVDSFGKERNSLVGKTYNLGARSEFLKLLKDGRPLPLNVLPTSGADAAMEKFIADSNSKSLLAFPLSGHIGLLGCLIVQSETEGLLHSDEQLGFWELISNHVANAIDLSQTIAEKNRAAGFFTGSSSACLLVDRNTLAVLSCNQSASKLLTGANVSLEGVNLGDLITPKAAVLDCVRNADKPGVAQTAENLALTSTKQDRGTVGMFAYPILESQAVAVILHTQGQVSRIAKSSQKEAEDISSKDGDQAAASRQLTWERWMRQIVCRVHSSLDRDSIMQSVVDSIGRALGVSRCMVVRTESVTAPIVTHEFAEPDVSPLGLGRTGQFPARTASHFKTRVKAVGDIVADRPNLQISDDELEWFVDSGFSSIAGAPISHHGNLYGVIVAISCGAPRKWLPNELDMLEVAAAETAIALENSQAFMQVKDQLFNMNLLGNLTQQLTNTLEIASRSNRSESLEDKSRAEGGGPPLSFRELEVLKLIASGLANREIAQRLFLTESTVELHASRIRKKLKLKSRTALVKYACDNDLV